jgi:hypothetical protein
MFLQENLNQKKTASYKDIRLELLEDIIIFNEQFEELKYEVCLTENALVATSEVNSKPEEKESLLKRMGDGAKKIWKTIIEYLTNLYDKIATFFRDLITKISLKNKKSRFNYLLVGLLFTKANQNNIKVKVPSEVELFKDFGIVKIFTGKLSALFREDNTDVTHYKSRVEGNIKKLEEVLDSEEKQFKTSQRQKVSIDEAISLFYSRLEDINKIVNSVDSDIKRVTDKLKTEANKFSAENNDDKVSEVRGKIAIANKAISFSLKIITKIISLVNISLDYKPRIPIAFTNKEGKDFHKNVAFKL